MSPALRPAGRRQPWETTNMYAETVDHFAAVAAKKSEYLRRSPGGFWISSMMAGAYVGLGIILVFCVGSDADPAYRGLIMGASFGIALTLVIFAGSDLFTGHTMFMSLGVLRRRVGLPDLVSSWSMTWVGNLVGAGLLAALFVAGGGGAMLCNWLVCLAIWMSARMTNDTAKCIAIFWCLFAFIGSGFEHSVANMTLLSIALLAPHPETVSLAGLGWNLLWVTIGNAIAGAGIMGFGYWAASRTPAAAPAAAGLAA